MKVLITTDWYKPIVNGVVTSITNLEDGLRSLGHDVRVAAVSNTSYSYKKDNVYFFASVYAGNIYPDARINFSPNKDLLDELIRWKPDVIHSQCEFSSFKFAARVSEGLNIPIVHTYHTVYEDYTHYFSPSEKWGKQVSAVVTKLLLSRVDMVIAPTQKVKGILERYSIKPHVVVIPTGINTDKYSRTRDPERNRKLRQEYGIPEDSRLLVYIGRIAEEKRLDIIVDYVARMNRDDIFLLVVGDGPARANAEKAVESTGLKNVHFTGMIPQSDIASYYQLGDVFVSASTSEAQGLTYYEALMAGTPIVCRHDPILDAIVINGENGYQFNDFESFKESIENILTSEFMTEEKRQSISENFKKQYSVEAFARNVVNTYETAIEKRKHPEEKQERKIDLVRVLKIRRKDDED